LVVTVEGWGFLTHERVRIVFIDSVNGGTLLRTLTTDAGGGFTTQVTIPAGVTPGLQHVRTRGMTSRQFVWRPFTVT
jgi:hypothetical protein